MKTKMKIIQAHPVLTVILPALAVNGGVLKMPMSETLMSMFFMINQVIR